MPTARVTSALQIIDSTTKMQYQSQPTAFEPTITGAKGPTPGALEIPVEGEDIDLSELVEPGLCRIMNLDTDNYVSWGIWDGTSFYPLGELLPGETYTFRLARDLGEEYGSGTGTTGEGINKWRFKADTAPVNVLVEAFER